MTENMQADDVQSRQAFFVRCCLNPFVYEEPDFHENGMDNPDNPCTAELTNEQLIEYLHRVREKFLEYMDNLTDERLYEKLENCIYTRLELIIRQCSHLAFHTGMINGQTAERTGKFPVYAAADTLARLNQSLYDE